jgi:hypothetical protein
MAFMGTFGSERKRGASTAYSDVGGDKTGTHATLSIRGQMMAPGVTSQPQPRHEAPISCACRHLSLIRSRAQAGLVFGARMLKSDGTLNWAFNGTGPAGIGAAGTSEVSSTNWDAIIGVRGRARFGSDLRWFVPYYADVGGGNSKFTWQGILGLGYSFSWGDVGIVWRYLDYEFKSGKPAQSLTFNGAAAGVSFTF